MLAGAGELAALHVIQLEAALVPGTLGHGEDPRVDHVLVLGVGAHCLAPLLTGDPLELDRILVTLGHEGVAVAVNRGLGVLRQVFRGEGEHLAGVVETGCPVVAALGRVYLVREVEVEVVRVREHNIIALVRPLHRLVEATPVEGFPEVDPGLVGGEHAGVRGVLQTIFPRLQGGEAVALDHLAHFLGEVDRQLGHVLDLAIVDHLLAHGGLAERLVLLAGVDVALPGHQIGFLGNGRILIATALHDVLRLVTTVVPGGQRLAGGLVHLGHFIHHLGHEGGSTRLARVDEGHLVVELHRGDVGGVIRVSQTELVRFRFLPFRQQTLVARLHGDHGGTGVRRHVDLGDHGHTAGLGIAHQVDVVGLAVEAGALVVAGGT
ncbi:hypothetical protein D3C79_452610 [compost metagenome]